MEAAHIALHHAGHAHSVEVWLDGRLVGGLYSVSIRPCFFGARKTPRTRFLSELAAALASPLQLDWFALHNSMV
jgi:leucyl/phenylalanyl-tRNA--protein transferase